jgi:predicted ferric reductase
LHKREHILAFVLLIKHNVVNFLTNFVEKVRELSLNSG